METVEAVVADADAEVLLLRELHRHHIKKYLKQEADMGNSTGSTMYMFGAVIVIYIVGVLIYQGYLWFKKKREQKRDEEFRRGDE